MNVFLLGLMGSGKTTIGKHLAKELGLSFIDLDTCLESQEKKTISEIFSEKGEAYFRSIEHQWLNDFDKDNCLISTGGGTPCFGNNLDLIKEKGISVYLVLSIEMIAHRLYQSKNTRPIIEPYKHDKSKLRSFLNDLLNERKSFYAQADVVFEVGNFNSIKKELLAKMVSSVALKKALL